ncbi:hypothetical protein HOK51_09190 [Candidatus Woesearchaeota archaeon]|jgi:hypothetical protein|nr:hypothetical protein [Candidatus Woesearchaeota archaeon]MBT6520004.1 hypothetical protein [Candidatus Woesearchaeota archaeon]MBT7367749.1 hypothetical protein [Candidatus Woesearchaeota archaeon]
MTQTKQYNQEKLEIITIMNSIYNEGGRPGIHDWSKSQVNFAADYVLNLLDGKYVDPETQQELQVRANAPQDLIFERSINSFTDFTSEGIPFLFYQDKKIADEKLEQIAKKIINNLSKTNFQNREYARTALAILTDTLFPKKVLLSAQNSWVDDENVNYDPEITNNKIIPEAIEYVKRKSIFLK